MLWQTLYFSLRRSNVFAALWHQNSNQSWIYLPRRSEFFAAIAKQDPALTRQVYTVYIM